MIDIRHDQMRDPRSIGQHGKELIDMYTMLGKCHLDWLFSYSCSCSCSEQAYIYGRHSQFKLVQLYRELIGNAETMHYTYLQGRAIPTIIMLFICTIYTSCY